MNWENKQIKLGEVKASKNIKVVFKALEDFDIVSLESSCGCSVPKYDAENKKLVVSYTPGAVPMHLKTKGYSNTVKTVTVKYSDGTSDILSFTATIKD